MSEIYTFIDLETTGLDYEKEQIIEIAAVKTDLEREYGRFQTFVHLNAGRTLSEEITKLTGITTDDLIGGIHPHDMSVALDFFAGTESTFVAHNAPFDLAFLAGLETEPRRFVCTRALAKLVEPTESPSLKDVCARHGIDLTGHHRAMNDVLATIEVFRKLAPIAEARGIEYRNVVVDSPERPLTFVPYNAKVVEVPPHREG
ncbi:exonuclease RNase T and DNA polymerase III [Brevibacillus borstelensis AK1]|uniref:Exonuclease RNase T and DNA polymerase III n=1 Tax=Brevibacillus borstelensis AK1 TaxID=1300222 RepID=M8DMP6_9BACL|nr:3'-5' exonuclease [Brevibacillus borstelensis]EMT54752.1 exonuclease RNase T and DNA polymerase III [Brevibacillus borstelensis AK1]